MDEKKDRAIPRLLDEIVINYGGGCCLYNSDCLDVLRTLPDGSVDMILQDPPYNMIACDWECELDFSTLWKEWERVIKDNGAIVMTASQPFTSELILSNKKIFKYEWIWEKSRPTGFFNTDIQPMKCHENVLVFYKKQPTFNPQITKAFDWQIDNRKTHGTTYSPYLKVFKKHVADSGYRQPRTALFFPSVGEAVHSSQKPVDLFRYLIRTYTNEGETVFDGYGGSGTTAVACIKENRKYIVCEKEAEYIEVTKKRIDEATRQGNLFSAVGCCPHDL